MAFNAVLDLLSGVPYLVRGGNVDFAAQPDWDPASFTQVTIDPTGPGQKRPLPGVPRRYQTATAAGFTELSAPDKATVDAFLSAQRLARLDDAVVIAAVFPNLAALPVPPPKAGAFVVVTNGPGGLPGLAMSTPTGYILFAADGSYP